MRWRLTCSNPLAACSVSKVESFRLLYHVLEIIPAYRQVAVCACVPGAACFQHCSRNRMPHHVRETDPAYRHGVRSVTTACAACPQPGEPWPHEGLSLPLAHVWCAASRMPGPVCHKKRPLAGSPLCATCRDRVQPLLRMLCASTPADDVEGFTAALQVTCLPA